MNAISFVHVDDDKRQLKAVQSILKEFTGIDLARQFDNAEEAKIYLENNPVDIVLIDIEMPGKNGLWLADKIKTLDSTIVFLTSHPDYALQAFDACALHYILKPLTSKSVEELLRRFGIARYFTRDIQSNESLMSDQLTELVGQYLRTGKFPKRIFINNLKRTTVLNLSEVLYFYSQGPYTVFKNLEGAKFTASKLLKMYYEALKGHPDFIRIHRAHVVNKNYVKAVLRDKHKIAVLMVDGVELEVSPQKREEIYTLLVN